MQQPLPPDPEESLTAELGQARAREAALRAILEVISQSRDDDRPVFDAILQNATRLCGADSAALALGRPDSPHLTLAALWQWDNSQPTEAMDTFIADINRVPMRMDPALHVSAQAICGRKVVHLADAAQSEGYLSGERTFRSMVEDQGIRTILSVPLFDAMGTLGAINLHRREVRLFSDDEIALVQSFAAQAVIAIENVRQFRELQTRLEREAATRDILSVISQSRDDDAPVFDLIAQSAAGLCGAAICTFWRVKDGLIHYCASHGLDVASFAETRSTPSIPLLDSTLTGQVVRTRAVVRIEDATAESYLDHEWARRQGLRQLIGVPIFIGDAVWGSINLMWPADRAAGDADIQLVESFADQASIAIENVRQFRELQTRLAREAATREILSVISQSRDDDKPVFDVVLRKAAELCHAPMASLIMISEDRSYAVLAADWGHHDIARAFFVGESFGQLDSDYPHAPCLREGRIVHLEDLADSDLYRSGNPGMTALVDQEGLRTFLAVPLFSDGQTAGCIAVYRPEVRRFTPDEIALVETFAAQAVIAIENVRQFRELRDSLEQQKATSDILRVISQSREDDARVFDLILEKAAVLCNADQGSLMIVNEARTHVRHMADWGHDRTAYLPGLEYSLDLPLSIVPTIRTAKVVHIEDYSRSDAYMDRDPIAVNLVETEGHRTRLIVPLLQNGIAIGCIALSRRVVRPFTPDEIALVETFAAQAVIAIENVRQFRELQTRLAREAATREILEVISQSRDDDGPVFDVILQNVARLCDTSLATFVRVNGPGTHVEYVAHWGMTLKTFDLGTDRWPLDGPLQVARSVREGRVINTPDLIEDDLYRQGDPTRVRLVDIEGVRSYLTVPLITTHREAIGCIALYRKELKPFTADEVALVETFAAQAVIAIENVRQFRELQTRLAREAATREILEVISQSRDDEAPVFVVVLRKAAELCHASMANLSMISEDRSHAVMMADWGDYVSGVLPVGGIVWQMDSDHANVICMREGRVVHVHDLADTDLYRSGDPIRTMAVDQEGIGTFLAVPLFSGDRTIACISVYRREVRPFTADEIALVETFAAQAVIAIENVRQFRELQVRLEREAATREILEVISQSRDDDAPVFDVVLRKAAELCHASMAGLNIISEDRSHAVCVAEWGDHVTGQLPVGITIWPMESDHAPSKCMREGRIVHVHDLGDTDLYRSGDPIRVTAVDMEKIRTFLAVPLFSNGRTVSCITIYRREVQPFTPDEIALVETFAAQAVIAIENVRQFRELQVRLEREAATRDILEVISRSRDDDAPVFDVIVRNAARLCNAQMAWLLLAAKAQRSFVLAGYHGLSLRQIELGNVFEIFAEPESITGVGRAIYRAQTVPEDDLAQTTHYLNGIGDMRMLVDVEGIRSRVSVPLISGGVGIGAIVLTRREVAPFTADQIALVETFAAQAVIAIENVRQFRELQTRLEREKALAAILEVISQSRENDGPVFDVILRNAARLCKAPIAGLMLVNAAGTHLVMAAAYGETLQTHLTGDSWPMDPPPGPVARSIRAARTLHMPDLALTDEYRSGHPTYVRLVDEDGLHTDLSVPLVRDGVGFGAITLSRREVDPFDDADIALVETFAAQAVIAIENVRQFRELQDRLAREAATREILEVISRNPDDDRPVFDAILGNAIWLCGADTSALLLGRRDDPRMTLAAWRDKASSSAVHDDAMIATFNATGLVMDPTVHISAQVICDERKMQVHDILQSEGYLSGEPSYVIMADTLGVRTVLFIPLIDARGALGVVHVHRREVRAFSEDEIALVETFAAQAVIAIENVRQFRELQARLEREAATKNILRVISESPDDEQPTFEAILDSATRLCGTQYASLVLGRRGDASQRMVAHRAAMAETLAFYREGKVPMDPEDSIGARAILAGITIHVPDMADTDQYRAGHVRFRLVVDGQGLRTNLFVPLLGPEGGIGCLILWKKEVAPFTADQMALMEIFASHAVIAIENVRQFKALEALNAELGDRVQEQVGEIERMGRLKRFLPAAVADAVVSSGSEKMLSSHRALLGVLFCDIRGFTAFCETAEPEETIEVLQTYHEEMGRLINSHGAGVDHRVGDGIMVLFNDPLPCDDPAGDAVRLAMAMRARMAELCGKWKKMGHRLGFGLGVSLGYATVGMVGSGGRFDYTASGTAINLASRLCDEAQDGEILISPRVRLAVEDDFTVESRGEISFKGIREPVEVFCVTGVV